MTVLKQQPVLATLYRKAWVDPPESHRHQLTHAVDAGFRIALCGMSTGVQRGSWPADVTVWDEPLGRCPVCARAIYGSPDRRA